MIYSLAIGLALAFGCAAVWKGSRRSSIPLLLSALLAVVFCRLGVPFSFFFWLAIDCAVIFAILYHDITYQDMAIVVLFFPAWVNYAVTGNEPNFWISWGIVMAQFAFTLPLGSIAMSLLHHIARFNRTYDPWKDLDLAVPA